MAKLSQKRARQLSFLLYKMSLTYDQQQREALLTAILDALDIDADQREESAKDAARSLRLDANRPSKRQAKPKSDDPIDNMSLDEITAHNKELLTKLNRLLEERRAEPQPASAQQTATTPEQEPTVEEAPTYDLPTAKMRKAVAAFDDMSDADQVDQLKSMWG